MAWREGTEADGSDSLGGGLRAAGALARDARADLRRERQEEGTSSTSGMQRTVETSPLLTERLRVVPGRMDAISAAIRSRDFDAFARITMADSNPFHAVCLDTAPPIFYLNDVSRSLIALVEEMNRRSLAAGKGVFAAYTFDAGPNCVIYAPEKNMPAIVRAVQQFFPLGEAFPDPFGALKTEPASEYAAVFDGMDVPAMPLDGWDKGRRQEPYPHPRRRRAPGVSAQRKASSTPDGMPKTLA